MCARVFKGQAKQSFERKIVIIILPISLKICVGCPKEPSRRDSSFEYSHYMFLLKTKKHIQGLGLFNVCNYNVRARKKMNAQINQYNMRTIV